MIAPGPIVGCDAGGSSATALAWHAGEICGRGKAGPANVTVNGVAAAADAVSAAVVQAAGADAPIAALYVGAAGAGRARLAQALADELRRRLPRLQRLMVEDDMRIALRSAIVDGPGAILIAGTGSAAYAESEAAWVRVGGAGYLVGDEGSAFAIGRAAVRRLIAVYDGRERSNDVAEAVAQALRVATRDELLDAVYGRTPNRSPDVARVAALAPAVTALAAAGNLEAHSIVRVAAADLAALLTAAARGAHLSGPRVAFGGGLLLQDKVLPQLVRAAVAATLPGATFIAATDEPAVAAVRLARNLLFGQVAT